MAVTPTYPGVYVQEAPSTVRSIARVGTSTALLIGRARQGPMFRPVRLSSLTDAERQFGTDGTLSDLPRYLRLFFLNGGSDAYVMRIADGAEAAEVTLQTEDGQPALRLVAKDRGATGEQIRAVVTYAGARPEASFTIELFRLLPSGGGALVPSGTEVFRNLTMDPDAPLYAPAFLTQESKLVDGFDAAAAIAAGQGTLVAGRPVAHADAGALRDAWAAITAANDRFRISVGGRRFVPVDLASIGIAGLADASVAAFEADLAAGIADRITAAYALAGLPGVTAVVDFLAGPAAPGGDPTRLLRLRAPAAGQDIAVLPSDTGRDLAGLLMLGAMQGGFDRGPFAARRPAPNGITIRTDTEARWQALMARPKSDLTAVRLDETQADGSIAPVSIATPVLGNAADPIYVDTLGNPALTGNSDGLRQKLGQLRDAVNAYRDLHPRSFPWTADLAGTRLTIRAASWPDNAIGTFATEPGAADLAALAGAVGRNTQLSSVGAGGIAGLQTPAAAAASDGSAPTAADYDEAFAIVDREVDLFNIMVLPPDREAPADMTLFWGAASAFCLRRRAVLLMDPPPDLRGAQDPTAEVNTLRQGVVKDHAALYYPRLLIREDGRSLALGPAGAVAGLMARIDATRGVWKAPAGIEADLRGIAGLEQRFSDLENGQMNPRAINTLRVFPAGVVAWGARTLDGDDDFASQWKYIPVRRTALMIEESLYRGLRWVVFEGNDEPLWAQIRLNAGAFMHGLFRQGAFQGVTPRDAYFVKCDAETTTQADRNLGIVNIVVGFAPLRPAEFVILTLQQMAGQIEA